MNPWSSLESQGTCVSAFGSHWNQHAFVVDIEHLLVNIRVPWIQLLLALCRLVKAGFSNLAVLTGASDSARFFFFCHTRCAERSFCWIRWLERVCFYR